MGKVTRRTTCTVYAICDQDGQIRYIGQTRTSVDVRIKYHLKKNTPISRWMHNEMQAERNVIVETITDEGTWNVSEILWIERAKAIGHQLLNKTRGGEDTPFDMQREEVSESQFYARQQIPFL